MEAGSEYTVKIYFFNGAESNQEYVAKDVLVKTEMPMTIPAGKTEIVFSEINSSNAAPSEIFDTIFLVNPQEYPVEINVIPETIKIFSQGRINGDIIDSGKLFSDGVNIGYDEFNGILPPGGYYGGFISFNFRVEKKYGELTLVATNWIKDWSPYQISMTSDIDEFTVMAQYKNTGTTVQENVVVKLKLPSFLEYIPTSTQLANASSGGKFNKVSDSIVNENGMNIGSYTPQSTARVALKLKKKSGYESEALIGDVLVYVITKDYQIVEYLRVHLKAFE